MYVLYFVSLQQENLSTVLYCTYNKMRKKSFIYSIIIRLPKVLMEPPHSATTELSTLVVDLFMETDVSEYHLGFC